MVSVTPRLPMAGTPWPGWHVTETIFLYRYRQSVELRVLPATL